MSKVVVLSGSNSKKHYARSIDRMNSILHEAGFSPCNMSTKSTLGNLDTNYERIVVNIPNCMTKHALISHIIFQLLSSLMLLKNRSDIETVILFKGAMGFVFPIIVARILRINTIVVKSGALMKERDLRHSRLITEVYTQAQLLSFRISNANIVFNEAAKKTVPGSDVYIANPEYIDVSKFNIRREYTDRQKIIGYVGRFGRVKRVEETVRAVKTVTEGSDYKGLFIGDGVQYDSIVNQYGSCSSLQFTGWVNYDELPQYYNRMKLLIIASDAEGGPATALEAMACGVPVLGTKVGMLPNLLDSDCGILLEDNSVESIISGIEFALESNTDTDTSKQCEKKITRRYTLCAVGRRYKQVLQAVNSSTTQS